MDENIGVKTTQAETTKIGENIYYNLYTSQLESVLKDNKKHKITLKEGDRNFFYRIAGNDTYQIAVQYAGIVTVNGKN